MIKVAINYMLPAIVLIHEIGHALATICVGGVVKKLHFGIWWGYVIPQGNFTDLDRLIIALSGSAVQVVAGILCLLAAYYIAKSPPIVALLVYTGIYSIGQTMVMYTLMSFGNMYGDWIKIYSSPLKEYVAVIALVHVSIVSLLVYGVYGLKPKIWFIGKTRPKWKKDYDAAIARVKDNATAVNYLSLAWSYYLVGIDKLAHNSLEKVQQLDPDFPDRHYLAGCMAQNNRDYEKAISCFENIFNSDLADNLAKARALMAIGHCLREQLPEPDDEEETVEAYAKVLETYDQAAKLIPETADPEFYKASLLNKVGLHKDAEIILKPLDKLEWLDPSLRAGVLEELKVARSSKKEDE